MFGRENPALVSGIDIRHRSSTPYSGMFLNFLRGSFIQNIHTMQLLSSLETSGFFWFFEVLLLLQRDVVNVLPSFFLLVLFFFLALILKLVPCVVT